MTPAPTAALSRRRLITGAAVTAGAVALARPGPALALGGPARPEDLDPRWAQDWIRTCYDVSWREGPSPTQAARCYGYVALAMYEACVAGMPGLRTLGGQLRDLPALPDAPRAPIDHPVALAAAAHTVARHVYDGAAAERVALLDAQLDAHVSERRTAGTPAPCVLRSVEHGRRVGRALNAWIDTDGHAGTVGRAYTPPTGESLWVSTPPNFGRAIEPHWSEVRALVMGSAGEAGPIEHVPFSTEPKSLFWQEADATYRASRVLTDEHRAIARFWTDNPLLSGLPSGHWFLIVVQVADQRRLSLQQVLEAMVRVGVALHEAFLSCWTAKYELNLLRPVTYLNRYVDPAWTSFVNTPQFPEYPSGHSVASRAAARVLTDLLGEFSFLDDSHRERGMAPRAFTSFTHAADEAAQSRLYGGIHFPMGIENGKGHGDRVGDIVLDRLRTRA